MYLLGIFTTIPLLLQKDDGQPRQRPFVRERSVFASADGNWKVEGRRGEYGMVGP
jgi:hypothetical protein